MKYLKRLKASQKKQIKKTFNPKLTKYIKFEPTRKQRIFLSLDAYLEVFFGGAAGPGKTIALLMAALQYVDVPGYNAILIRDTYANLSKPDSLIPVSHEWLKPTDAYWKGTDRIWQFPSGATLSFGHLDDPTSHFDYQSAQFQFVGIDEMVAIREHQAMYMFSRLRKIKEKDCPIRFRGASNPPTREQLARGEWVKTRYVDDETREPGVIFLPAWMEDNPHLDIEEYDKSLDKLDTVTRKQLKEGDWNVKAKGKMFEREWFKIIDVLPQDVISTIRYWDFAATAKTDDNNPAYAAGVKMAKTKEGIYVIEDVRRVQKEPGDIERLVKTTAAIDGIKTKIWIEQEPGSSGKMVIAYYVKSLAGYTIHGDRVTGSKVDRAHPYSCQAEAGNVWVLKGSWNRDYFEELELFPDGLFKDQTDASSGAFNKLSFGTGRARASVVRKKKYQGSVIDKIIEAEKKRKQGKRLDRKRRI